MTFVMPKQIWFALYKIILKLFLGKETWLKDNFGLRAMEGCLMNEKVYFIPKIYKS